MNKKVLITGASGFIGSFLVEEALREGFEVYAGIRPSSSREYLTDERIQFINLDLSSVDALKKTFEEFLATSGTFDYVIHNAGITYAPRKEEFEKVNFNYTKNLTEALASSSMTLTKFVLVSSLAVFGPGDERTFAPIRITSRQLPISSYAKSKLLGELHVKSITSFPFLILNPTAVYGPRDKDFLEMVKLINKGFEFYIGSHKQMISLIFVKDLARAIVLAMKSEAQQRAFIISDGENYSKEGLGATVRTTLSKKTIVLKIPATPFRWLIGAVESVYILFGKLPFLNTEKVDEISSANWLCDSQDFWEEVSSKPTYSLEQGIRETVAWYKEKGWI
ncbi:MAG: NAD(P)-dependent oxidoreductase [Bacteroidetes bacterium]|nr:NAD(P)-dependent oxidoreductase [Bacteroidota bacterium]